MQWAFRYRQQWPSNSTIDKIVEDGCLLVPIGPRTQPDCDVLWRLSFSMAEKQLIHSFNHTQLLCYGLLKLALKHIINTRDQATGLLCSYFMKTALFWVSEEVDIDTFQLPEMFYCFTLCIDKLILWVHNCFCPNYFIPEHNMFLGKINSDNNKILIQVLNRMKNHGIDDLIRNLISNDKDKYRFLYTKETSSFILLDFLFFRICGIGPTTHISHYLKALVFIESLIKSKSSTFIIGVCKYLHAEISQYAAQVLPPPSVTTEAGNIHKSYQRYLLDGTKTDAVSGWLLYASFYYVTGQFDATLRLTDTVLSRCSPDMVLIGCVYYHERHIKNYRNHVHSTMTLNDKMRIATLKSIIYSQSSSLIPRELQLEVKDQEMCLPPTVMAHCLRFLCFHHLGDFPRRQTALHDLYKTVNDTKKNSVFLSMLSNSFTILGVCYEVSGEKDIAYECYDKALQCESGICTSAKARKLKLLQI
ncbi:Hypothetical predicted protein [Mytilus galloprovincialis]|uniref:Mab-21-like HhH/H2TH-like domain-containing protein n=1 Tax=Mytilus galloprovincialis TaxID=29158 RepID=A0A8B6FHL2_MYTGA|nr:Hypothetical predicted protein [Mytilus galloprovincialis]